MQYYPFPASLVSGDGRVREFGAATLLPDSNALHFESDFVPLLPLGSEATVTWVQGDKCLAAFRGKVYLSSPRLLRLVDIDSSLLASVRTVLSVNAAIPAAIVPADSETLEAAKAPPADAEIVYLSTDLMKLKTTQIMGAQHTLLLNAEVDFLTLRNQPLLVRERLVLRRSDNLLICEVLPGSEENFISLTAYAAKLTAAESKKTNGNRNTP